MKLLLFILMFLMICRSAYGVVPSAWPFLQGLVSFLPQILFFLLIGASFIFRFSTWKRLFLWLGRILRTKVGIGVTAGIVVLLFGLVLYLVFFGAEGTPVRSSAGDAGAGWAGFRGNVLRSGCGDDISGPQEGTKTWAFREPFDRGGFASSPAAAGDRVYVGGYNSILYCFDGITGNVIWEFEALYEIFSSPAVYDNKVYFGEGLHYTEDATFHCVDAITGQEIWSFPTTSHGESSPYVADGKVVFGGAKDGIYCLDAETGDQIWRYESVYVAGSPLIFDNKVYFGSGYGKNGIFCLNLDDGEEIWAIDTEYPAWGAPAAWENKVYIGTGPGNFVFSDDDPAGKMMCLDAAIGESLWEFDLDDTILGAVAIDNGRIYFGSRDSNLYCVDALSGEEIWTFTTGGAIVSSPAVVKGDVYFGSTDGTIYCLDTQDGIEKWEFNASESGIYNVDSRIISSPAVSKGRLYVGSMNFFFYCIGEEMES